MASEPSVSNKSGQEGGLAMLGRRLTAMLATDQRPRRTTGKRQAEDRGVRACLLLLALPASSGQLSLLPWDVL